VLLFVVLTQDRELDQHLRRQIVDHLRAHLSPRHTPDEIIAVPAIPRTLSGKKLEAPVKQILQGAAVSSVVNIESFADPSALEPFLGNTSERTAA
jgi:acetoacetyl-CoA synthetase